jgi:hypothetical protein
MPDSFMLDEDAKVIIDLDEIDAHINESMYREDTYAEDQTPQPPFTNEPDPGAVPSQTPFTNEPDPGHLASTDDAQASIDRFIQASGADLAALTGEELELEEDELGEEFALEEEEIDEEALRNILEDDPMPEAHAPTDDSNNRTRAVLDEDSLEEMLETIIKTAGIDDQIKELARLKVGLQKENKLLKYNGKKVLEENKRLQEVVEYLRQKVEDVNLSNAKLLYINQTLESVSLNERQKDKIVETISKADSVKEAKMIFETLQNSVGTQNRENTPKSLSESVTNRSSLLLAARQQKKNEPQSPFFDRMQKLAGLKLKN